METVPLRVIGRVRSPRTSTADADWNAHTSWLELNPEFAEGLVGLEAFSHALVIFWMHVDPDDEAPTMTRRPRGRADMPLLGVFAQRGRMRPNPIGVTTVEVLRVEPGRVEVRGLDAIDGTPLLDLKPYVPVFDHAGHARVPAWMDELMRGYFGGGRGEE